MSCVTVPSSIVAEPLELPNMPPDWVLACSKLACAEAHEIAVRPVVASNNLIEFFILNNP